MGDWRLDRDGKWAYFPDDPPPGPQPATTMLPMVAPTRLGDVGDWIDPNAPDPTGDEVTDRADPSYVDPWFGEA
jgi:hypothetical protein